MRTTLTIEDRLIAELRRSALASGKSFKQVVNEALQAGLRVHARPEPRVYRLEPTAMGQPASDVDVAKARQVADGLTDEEIVDKLRQRK